MSQFKSMMLSFPVLPSRIENSTSIPTTLYEFPNGYNINLTVEKYKLCEGLFDSSNLKGVSGGNLLSIPSVTINSAAMCEVDIRPVCELPRLSCRWLAGYIGWKTMRFSIFSLLTY